MSQFLVKREEHRGSADTLTLAQSLHKGPESAQAPDKDEGNVPGLAGASESGQS